MSVNNVSGGYVVGVDFGTLSGRALVVRVADGAELGTAVHQYRHGVMGQMQAGAHHPNPVSADVYDQLYAEYVALHDYFGRGANEVIRALRNRVRAGEPAGPGPGGDHR